MSKRTEVKLRRQRQARLQTAFVAVLVVVVVAVVGYLIFQSQQSGGKVPATSTIDPGKSFGPTEAKVIVREFADFQCPYCGKFAVSDGRQFIIDQANAGKLRFEYHHYIVVDIPGTSDESRHAAWASECANEQGKFWDYSTYLFTHQNGEHQGAFSDANLKTFAVTLGLDTATFNPCFDAKRYATKVAQDDALGQSLGVFQTPSLFINNTLVKDPLDINEIKTLINAAVGAN